MKLSTVTLTSTLVLSVVLWIGYYFAASGHSPTPEETMVLVAIAFALVTLTRWALRLLRKSREKNE